VTRPLIARLRPLLFLLGVLLLAYLVHRAGPGRVLETARAGLSYLPFLALLQGAFYLFENCGQRTLLGPDRHRVPTSVFLRATLTSYVASVLVPVGRAGAEVARVSAYSPHVGAPRALAASTAFQAPALIGTAVLGGLCAVVSWIRLGASAPLTWVLVVHAAGSVALGALLFLVLSQVPLGRYFSRLFPSLAARAESFDQATALPGSAYLAAIGWCVLARASEILQYGVLLAAVGLPIVPESAILASGIQIVGATAGEAIPGQLGAIESAFVYFGSALGLPPHSSHAVTMPLLARVGQYGLAAVFLLILNPWLSKLRRFLPGARSERDRESPAPSR